MLGLMQDQPLLISSLIDFAERHHGDAEIVSRRVEGDIHRYTWRDVGDARAAGGASAGPAEAACSATASPRWPGTATATWSCTTASAAGPRAAHHQPAPASGPDRLDRQPCRGPGAVLRPELPAAGARRCTPQLPDDQAVRSRCAMRDKLPADSGIPNLRELRGLDRRPSRPTTTGPSSTRTRPRACATRAAPPATPRARCTATARPCCTPMPRRCPTCMGLSARDSVLPVVPMFHVNAWGIPYSARAGRRQAGVPRPGAGRQVGLRADRGREGDASPPACPRSGRCCSAT